MLELRVDPRGPLRIWQKPVPGSEYVLGADTGGGRSAHDWCAAVVLHAPTRSIAAVFRAHLETDEFADAIWTLARYYGTAEAPAFTVPEANNHGLAVINRLREIGHSRLYMRQVWDSTRQRMLTNLGFTTSVKTRPMLIALARRALGDPAVAISCPLLLTEMTTFVIDENGREDHLDGTNDDVLFAWMLALEGAEFFRREAEAGGTQDLAGSRDSWVWDKMREESARRASVAAGTWDI